MPSIQSPATILALLKKAKTAYQKKEPDPKDKPELRHKEIVAGLQRLRELAQKKTAGANGAALAGPFSARQKILLKLLTEHRKKLNGTDKNADPNKAQLPAYVKALLKLTNALLGLEFARVTAAEEAGINLEELEEGDPAVLDGLDSLNAADLKALEQQDAGNQAGPTGEEQPQLAADEDGSTQPLESAAALQAWQLACEQVIGAIRKAAAAVAVTKDPHARDAIIELHSIIKKLTPTPQTPQEVTLLQSYLQTDRVIADAEGLPSWLASLQIREPLLKALKALKL